MANYEVIEYSPTKTCSIIERYTENPKIAFVTSIYGAYDSVIEHTNVSGHEVDWYCFTNQPIQSSRWRIVHTTYQLKDDVDGKNAIQSNLQNPRIFNMMSAKYYKINSHKIDILQPYDYVVWLDARISITNDFIPFVLEMIRTGHKLIHYKHSERNNVKDEVQASLGQQRYVEQNVIEQFEQYKQNGFPDQTGLFENGMFIRSIKDDKINAMFDSWWKHNVQYSFQDQLSYPYVLWEASLYPDYVIQKEGTVWRSKYTVIRQHHHM